MIGGRELTKVDPTGTTAVYDYLIGGSGYPPNNAFDVGLGVAVDAQGNAYVTGDTYSIDLPTTVGAFQTTPPTPNTPSRQAAFVAKVNASGTGLVYGTYLGNVSSTSARGIAIDASGNAYITGFLSDSTSIPNFPGPVTTFGNLNSSSANIHAYVAKLNASGSALSWFSRIGGSHCVNFICNASQTRGLAIAVDSVGAAWVTGLTGSTDIPMVKALQSDPSGLAADIFVAKLAPAGNTLQFSTRLRGTTVASPSPPNGTSNPVRNAIALDAIGSAYIAGVTNQSDYPVTQGAFQTTLPAGTAGMVTKINETKDTTTTLTVSPNPTSVGTATTLTATIVGNSPSGTVAFKDGAATLGSGTITGTTAQLTTSSLSGGAHSVTASYAGDAHNNPSDSTSVVVNVSDPQSPPSGTLSGIVDGATFTASTSGTYTGASVTLTAFAAAGNALVQVRIYLDGNYTFWNVSGSSVTEVLSLPALNPGVHTLFGTVQDDQGHTVTTSAIRFVVNPNGATPPTGVTLTSPTSGATFVSPEAIALAATATPLSGKTISRIDYYAGSVMVASSGASPFSTSWSGAQPGSYSVRAAATDSAGGLTLSAPVTITVGPPQPPTVSLTSPAAGATYTAPATITMSATASAAVGATISRVEFLQGSTVVGTATSSPYGFSWISVAAGSYSVAARAVDSRGSMTTTSPVSVVVAAAPTLSISANAGLDGATTAEDSILVAGSITAPPNSGVLINGFLATVSSNGQFSANNVPLVAGANNITLTVTTQDGDTATQSISVTSSGGPAPFDVSIDEPDGIAPHTVNISVESRAGLPFSTIEFDFDGDGTVDYTAQGLPSGPVQVVYSSAGVMKPRVTFKDASGSVVYATTRQVHVATPQDKYQIIKGAYSDMVNRLSAGTTSTAMNLFVDSARTVYQGVFDNIGSSALPAAASQLGTLQSIAFSTWTAELILTRTVNGSLQTFQVHLIRGGDGIWRIESM